MMIIEWAPFKTNAGVNEAQLVERATAVQREFIAQQTGFLKRTLIKKSDNEYADILHWQSRADAETASENVMSCGVCLAYFELMDQSAQAGAGFAHYTIVEEWTSAP